MPTEGILKLLLIIGITMFVAVLTSFAQQPAAVISKEWATGDTSSLFLHAERSIIKDSSGIQYTIYEGNVEAAILHFRIKADRLELYDHPLRMVATGNVVVTIGGIPIQAKRFEWNRNEPGSPIIFHE
jgi:lipopolysaccharide assembly outer membrane protein LptD (OstA)